MPKLCQPHTKNSVTFGHVPSKLPQGAIVIQRMAPQYVQLLSNDGHKFIITREAAKVSGFLKSSLGNSAFEESKTGIIPLDFDSAVLSRVCDYFYYNLQFKEDSSKKFDIPPALALELLVAADYLDA